MSIDKIICVGKNYLEHAKELGDAIPEKPVLFLKPPSVLKQVTQWGETLHATLPQVTGEIHYECEMVLRIAQGGYQMNLQQAQQAFDAVSLGLDMTLRTLQTQLKKNGHPWTLGKVFPDAALLGPWIATDDFSDFMDTEFLFTLNDQVRQQTYPHQMMLNPAELIVYISQHFPLCAGDVIFTGTPAGVGAVIPGDEGRLIWQNHHYNVSWSSL